MGGGRIFLKTHSGSLFNEDLSNEPNSAGSISMDSTFKRRSIELVQHSLEQMGKNGYCDNASMIDVSPIHGTGILLLRPLYDMSPGRNVCRTRHLDCIKYARPYSPNLTYPNITSASSE